MTTLATFGNFMGMDGLMILVVVLLLFGAKKLPELARGLGQSLNEFKKARDDFEHELRSGQQDVQAREASGKQSFNAPPAAVPTQALPYNQNVPDPMPVAAAQSPEALQQQVEQLQQQLRSIQEQSSANASVK